MDGREGEPLPTETIDVRTTPGVGPVQSLAEEIQQLSEILEREAASASPEVQEVVRRVLAMTTRLTAPDVISSINVPAPNAQAEAARSQWLQEGQDAVTLLTSALEKCPPVQQSVDNADAGSAMRADSGVPAVAAQPAAFARPSVWRLIAAGASFISELVSGAVACVLAFVIIGVLGFIAFELFRTALGR